MIVMASVFVTGCWHGHGGGGHGGHGGGGGGYHSR